MSLAPVGVRVQAVVKARPHPERRRDEPAVNPVVAHPPRGHHHDQADHHDRRPATPPPSAAPRPLKTTQATSAAGTYSAHDGRTSTAAPDAAPVNSPQPTAATRDPFVPRPRPPEDREPPLRQPASAAGTAPRRAPAPSSPRRTGRPPRPPPRQRRRPDRPRRVDDSGSARLDQPRDQPDAPRPERRLHQPDRQQPRAERELTGRQEERVARRPQREVGQVAPVGDLERLAASDLAGERPVDRGVGEDAQHPLALGVPLHHVGRRDPQPEPPDDQPQRASAPTARRSVAAAGSRGRSWAAGSVGSGRVATN